MCSDKPLIMNEPKPDKKYFMSCDFGIQQSVAAIYFMKVGNVVDEQRLIAKPKEPMVEVQTISETFLDGISTRTKKRWSQRKITRIGSYVKR